MFDDIFIYVFGGGVLVLIIFFFIFFKSPNPTPKPYLPVRWDLKMYKGSCVGKDGRVDKGNIPFTECITDMYQLLNY